MNKKILFFAFIFIFILSSISAASPPKFVYFNLNFSSIELPQGDWQLSRVDLSGQEVSEKEAKNLLEIITADYLPVKSLCGVPDYLISGYDSLQKKPQELSDAGYYVYSDDYEENYLFIEDSTYNSCAIPYGYGQYNSNFETIYENKYKATINFWIYVYKKGHELYEAGARAKFSYPNYCEIEEDICQMSVSEGVSNGPYIFVLEKMNSNSEIYFSNPILVNWNYSGDLYFDYSPNIYELNIETFNINDGELSLSFIGSKKIDKNDLSDVSPKLKSKIIYTSFVLIILVLIILFIIYKRRK